MWSRGSGPCIRKFSTNEHAGRLHFHFKRLMLQINGPRMGEDGSVGASGPDGSRESQAAQAHDAAASPLAPASVEMPASSAGQVAVAQEEPAAAAVGGDSGNCSSEKKSGAVDEGSNSGAPVEVPEEVRAAIVRQVEFYFGDANLPTDDYLMKLVKKNSEGWGEHI